MEARNLNIPKEVVAGDTIEWNETLSGYPSGEYTAKFFFIPYRTGAGATAFSVTGSGDGSDVHTFSISKVASASIIPGIYKGSVTISNANSRFSYAAGIELTVLPNPETTTTYPKTQAETILDNVNSAIEKVLKTGVAVLTVNGRTIEYTSPKELFELKKFYESEVRREKALLTGKYNTTIYCRFS